jgi:hypothetical protein
MNFDFLWWLMSLVFDMDFAHYLSTWFLSSMATLVCLVRMFPFPFVGCALQGREMQRDWHVCTQKRAKVWYPYIGRSFVSPLGLSTMLTTMCFPFSMLNIYHPCHGRHSKGRVMIRQATCWFWLCTQCRFHLVPYFEECSPGVVTLIYEFLFQILRNFV